MERITVDGCNYYVDIVVDSCDYSVHVEVFDAYHDKVGAAVVDHNTECVGVHYVETDTSASYNYFELERSDAGYLHLAEWIVATDPVIG